MKGHRFSSSSAHLPAAYLWVTCKKAFTEKRKIVSGSLLNLKGQEEALEGQPEKWL